MNRIRKFIFQLSIFCLPITNPNHFRIGFLHFNRKILIKFSEWKATFGETWRKIKMHPFFFIFHCCNDASFTSNRNSCDRRTKENEWDVNREKSVRNCIHIVSLDRFFFATINHQIHFRILRWDLRSVDERESNSYIEMENALIAFLTFVVIKSNDL